MQIDEVMRLSAAANGAWQACEHHRIHLASTLIMLANNTLHCHCYSPIAQVSLDWGVVLPGREVWRDGRVLVLMWLESSIAA
jgi:hypothetical protein